MGEPVDTSAEAVERLCEKLIFAGRTMAYYETPMLRPLSRGHFFLYDSARRDAATCTRSLQSALTDARNDKLVLTGMLQQSRASLTAAQQRISDLEAQCARAQRDAERFEWFFGDSDKLPFMSNYLLGIREAWTPDQWRASIDAAMAAKGDDWLTREARQIGLHSPACASFGQNECDCGAKP